MSSNPLNRDYQVPGPIPQPILTKELISSSGQPLGQRLFDDTTEFYSWYVSSWYMSTTEGSSFC